MKYQKSVIIVFVCIFPLAFRNVLVTLFGGLGQALSVAPLVTSIMFVLYRLTIANKVNINLILPYSFILYAFFCVLIFPLIGIVDFVSTPIVGFFQLIAPLCLSLMIMHLYKGADYAQFVINVLVIFGFVNALGGIVQFYFSPDLFGLISNRVYDGVTEYNVTKRAVSILASPQSLSIFLAFSLTIVRYCSVSFLIKTLMFLTIFFCGVLSGSKAFFVFLLAYLLLSTSLKNVLFVVFIVVGLVLFSLNYRTGIDTFDRVLDIPVKLAGLSDYITFQIWSDFVLYPSSILEVFFGRGIGVMSNSSQTINNYQIFGGSTESFLIQLYFELGIVGLVLFVVMFAWIPIKYIYKGNPRPIAVSVLALFSNMAFSPAFFGFATSTLFFFAYSICLRANIKNEKSMCFNDRL